MSNQSNIREKILYFLLGTAIIIFYFSRLFFPEQQLFSTPDFGHSDLWHFNIPVKYVYSKALKNNKFPYTVKEIGKNFPLIGENQVGAFNLQNIILYKFLPFITAFNLTYILIFLTTFIGCYSLFLEFKIAPTLSLTGALTLTFSGFFISQIVHLNLIQTASYFPILFFLLERLSKNHQKRYFAMFTFLQTQCFFAGFPQFFLIINFFFFVYLLLLKNKKNIIIYFTSISISLIFCLIQIIPSLSFTKEVGRSHGLPTNSLSAFPYSFKNLLAFFNPYIFGNPKYGTYPLFNSNWGIFWESTFYIGIVTIIIFLSTIFLRILKMTKALPKNIAAKISISHKDKSIFLIGFFSLLLGLGKYTPAFLLIQILPFSLFRNPARFIFLFMFMAIFMSFRFLNQIHQKLSTLKKNIFSSLVFFLVIPELMMKFYSYNLILPARKVLEPPPNAKLVKTSDVIYSHSPYTNWNKIFLNKGWGSKNEIESYIFLKNQLDENINALWEKSNINVYAGSIPKKQIEITNKIQNLLKINGDKISISDANLRKMKRMGITIIFSPRQIQGALRQVNLLRFKTLQIYTYRL